MLGRAKDRLHQFVPPELRDRLRAAFDTLELVTRLDAIRLECALVKPPPDLLNNPALPVSVLPRHGQAAGGDALSGRLYEQAFRAAGIGAPGDDPAAAAARVRAAPVRGALVAALDDWATCAPDREQRDWILAVANICDDLDPWRLRVRDPATWKDGAALQELADAARVREQSPQLLAVLGARLRATKLNAVPFLSRVASAYPADFWVNIEMGNALSQQKNLGDAVGYYRIALALRPETVALHYALAELYLALLRWDDCIAEYEQALHLAPENALCHNRLGFTLAWRGGRDDDAIAEFREAVRLDGSSGWFHYCLAVALERKGSLEEAAAEFLQAAQRSSPEKRAEWMWEMRKVLLRLGRGAEALADWKEALATHPPHHDDWFGFAELCLFLEDEAEYRRARNDLLASFGATTDPLVAERTGRACLLLSAPAEELRQAVMLIERRGCRTRRTPCGQPVRPVRPGPGALSPEPL